MSLIEKLCNIEQLLEDCQNNSSGDCCCQYLGRRCRGVVDNANSCDRARFSLTPLQLAQSTTDPVGISIQFDYNNGNDREIVDILADSTAANQSAADVLAEVCEKIENFTGQGGVRLLDANSNSNSCSALFCICPGISGANTFALEHASTPLGYSQPSLTPIGSTQGPIGNCPGENIVEFEYWLCKVGESFEILEYLYATNVINNPNTDPPQTTWTQAQFPDLLSLFRECPTCCDSLDDDTSPTAEEFCSCPVVIGELEGVDSPSNFLDPGINLVTWGGWQRSEAGIEVGGEAIKIEEQFCAVHVTVNIVMSADGASQRAHPTIWIYKDGAPWTIAAHTYMRDVNGHDQTTANVDRWDWRAPPGTVYEVRVGDTDILDNPSGQAQTGVVKSPLTNGNGDDIETMSYFQVVGHRTVSRNCQQLERIQNREISE